MLQHLRPALLLTILFTMVTGLAYPLAMTGLAQFAFREQADGGLIARDGRIVGSTLIGQSFVSPRYFHGRPSATNAPDPKDPAATIDAPYNAANSGGANLAPTSKKLVERVEQDARAWRAGIGPGLIPGDAVTTSASGLDPDISPQSALAQAASVAQARQLPAARVRALVEAAVEQPLLGFIGKARVNVLRLNLALDRLGSS